MTTIKIFQCDKKNISYTENGVKDMKLELKKLR